MIALIKKTLCLFFLFLTFNLSAQVTISGMLIDDYTSGPMDGATGNHFSMKKVDPSIEFTHPPLHD